MKRKRGRQSIGALDRAVSRVFKAIDHIYDSADTGKAQKKTQLIAVAQHLKRPTDESNLKEIALGVEGMEAVEAVEEFNAFCAARDVPCDVKYLKERAIKGHLERRKHGVFGS